MSTRNPSRRDLFRLAAGGLAVAVDHLGASILSRSVGAAERSELVGEMRACRDRAAAGDGQGCIDDASAVRWLCRRMIDSVEFGTY